MLASTAVRTKVALIHARKDPGCDEVNPAPAAPPKIRQPTALRSGYIISAEGATATFGPLRRLRPQLIDRDRRRS